MGHAMTMLPVVTMTQNQNMRRNIELLLEESHQGQRAQTLQNPEAPSYGERRNDEEGG